MKKTLLIHMIIVSSVFFSYAQFKIGSSSINIGRVCKIVDGSQVCLNPSTGEYGVVDAQGSGVQVNTKTGAFGIGGVFGGTKIQIGGGGGASQTFGGQGGPLLNFLALAQTIVARLVPFLIGVALLAFFWFLIEFIWKGVDDPKKQSEGKAGMGWAILAIFIMVSIWGIIGLAGSILGIEQGGKIKGFALPGE